MFTRDSFRGLAVRSTAGKVLKFWVGRDSWRDFDFSVTVGVENIGHEVGGGLPKRAWRYRVICSHCWLRSESPMD